MTNGVQDVKQVALVTGASSGIGEADRAQVAGRRVDCLRRGATGRPHVGARAGGCTTARPRRDGRRVDGRGGRGNPGRHRTYRCSRQQRGIRLVWRHGRRPARRGSPAIRGQRLRACTADAARGAAHAAAAQRTRAQRGLDGRQDPRADGQLVPRDEVRGRRHERLRAHGAGALRRGRGRDQPGAIQSEWNAIARESLLRTSGSTAYAEQARITAGLLAGADKDTASPPTVVADSVWLAVTARRPKTRYLMGGGAKLLVGLRWLLSDRAFDRVMTMAAARMARAA